MNDYPRKTLRALKPNPGLRTGHLPPIRCTCGGDVLCQVPHDLWLIQGARLEK